MGARRHGQGGGRAWALVPLEIEACLFVISHSKLQVEHLITAKRTVIRNSFSTSARSRPPAFSDRLQSSSYVLACIYDTSG